MASSGLAADCGSPDYTIRAPQNSRPHQGKRLRVATLLNKDVSSELASRRYDQELQVGSGEEPTWGCASFFEYLRSEGAAEKLSHQRNMHWHRCMALFAGMPFGKDLL